MPFDSKRSYAPVGYAVYSAALHSRQLAKALKKPAAWIVVINRGIDHPGPVDRLATSFEVFNIHAGPDDHILTTPERRQEKKGTKCLHLAGWPN
ncbi:hypothetical protein [Mycobacterium sp. UM_CSW]|uniref:hypothetical protein n=1 Tax=Mycobacterium sp. UM_CSW TaxID=1370119 RepID=UPI001268EA84|nr:hypothetical protein [Mycobacterium sp. UM_CSW]